MRLHNYRKETSERSDAFNWAKNQLIHSTPYFYDGIEGCNQNAKNQTTHLFERAQVDIDTSGPKSKDAVIQSIVDLESESALIRKINFATSLGIPLSYVLHDDATGYVFMLSFDKSVDKMKIDRSFSSYQGFGQYLAEIKGWRSTKKFRESDDLPLIDKVLRQNGTPWPTNIDCFCTDQHGKPVAIIEYQNAETIGVLHHSNNDYFLCKQRSVRQTERGTKVIFHDDIRRWTSQEILRVQSQLPLMVITWSQSEQHYQLKEVEQIAFPDFEMDGSRAQWSRMTAYKEDLHRFSKEPMDADFQVICQRNSMSFVRTGGIVTEMYHKPPLSIPDRTFPHIYWRRKAVIEGDRNSLSGVMMQWLSDQ